MVTKIKSNIAYRLVWCTLALAHALFMGSCAVGSIPQPGATREDSPTVNENDDAAGAPDAKSLGSTLVFAQSSALLLAGPTQTFPGPGGVEIDNNAGGEKQEAQSADDGSFSAYINAEVGDILTLGWSALDDEFDVRNITVTVPDLGNFQMGESADAIAAAPPQTVEFEVNLDSGRALITAGPGAVPASIPVWTANPSQGAAAQSTSTNDGSVSLSIQAQSGDTVELLLFEDEDATGAITSVQLEVP